MVLARMVFQAKLGKANDLVAGIKEGLKRLSAEQSASLQPRILTDLSGRFDTVVFETTYESLAAYEQFRQVLFAMAEASEEPLLIDGLIDTGHNEYWTIET